MEVIEKIEKYIEGKLEGEALQDFETQLKSNPRFKQEVEEFRQLIEEVKKAGEKNFVAKVEEWEKKAQLLEEAENASNKPIGRTIAFRAKEDIAPKPNAGPGASWIYMAIPAAAAAIVLFVFLLFPSSGEIDASQLYSDNFTPYPDLYTNLGEVQDDRQKAIAPYNEGDYATAVISFKQFLEQHPDDQLGKLYLAISLIENNQIQEGQNLLNEIGSNETNNLAETAQWYQALSYLKLDNIEACKSKLEMIKDLPDHDYQSRAEKLFERLD